MTRITKNAVLRGIAWIAIGGCAYGVFASYLSPSITMSVLQIISFCG